MQRFIKFLVLSYSNYDDLSKYHYLKKNNFHGETFKINAAYLF